MLDLFVALFRADAGSIALLGDDVWRNRETLMERVGIVPEDADASPDMRVEALARFWSSLYSRWSAAMFDERMRRFAIAPPIRPSPMIPTRLLLT